LTHGSALRLFTPPRGFSEDHTIVQSPKGSKYGTLPQWCVAVSGSKWGRRRSLLVAGGRQSWAPAPSNPQPRVSRWIKHRHGGRNHPGSSGRRRSDAVSGAGKLRPAKRVAPPTKTTFLLFLAMPRTARTEPSERAASRSQVPMQGSASASPRQALALPPEEPKPPAAGGAKLMRSSGAEIFARSVGHAASRVDDKQVMPLLPRGRAGRCCIPPRASELLTTARSFRHERLILSCSWAGCGRYQGAHNVPHGR
jgi:hypothetical protein